MASVVMLSNIFVCEPDITVRNAAPNKRMQMLVRCSRAALQLEQASNARDEIAALPSSCPVPDFSPEFNKISLLNPLKATSKQVPTAHRTRKNLLVYVPGMDCTGQGIRKQLPSLIASGYDVRCVYIPSSDRSSWSELVRVLVPLLQEEAKLSRNLTLVGESFGGCLALRLTKAAGDLVSKLILVNPASNFEMSNRPASFLGRTGFLGLLSQPLYELAQEILYPFMVRQSRVFSGDEVFSPVDFVPPDCTAWRLSMLNNQTGLLDRDLQSINTPTLILAAAKDRLLSSLDEASRLEKLLPKGKRVILPDSGHMSLLEDGVDLAAIVKTQYFLAARGESELTPADKTVSNERMDELGRILSPWRLLTSPLVSGAENLPSPVTHGRPVLFVGNHTIFGVYDSAMLVHELYLRGFKCRSLAHPIHWNLGVNEVFERYGSVKATKFEAYRLLKEGQHVLLFPGGAREVCKRRNEEYKLFWKSNTDFVRMATRLKAIIVPFAALGGDDAFNILFDTNDILSSFLGDAVHQLLTSLKAQPDEIQAISALPGTSIPSLIPLPSSIERIYFHFAECIDNLELNTDIKNREECHSLYLLVKRRVEQSIAHLQNVRAKDPVKPEPPVDLSKTLLVIQERDLGARLLAKLQRISPTERIINRSRG